MLHHVIGWLPIEAGMPNYVLLGDKFQKVDDFKCIGKCSNVLPVPRDTAWTDLYRHMCKDTCI